MECGTDRTSAQTHPRRGALMSWAKQLAKEGKIVEVGRNLCHREHFRSSHAAGWWNAHLPGSLTTVV
jgi:hypothetical protein